MTVQEPSLLVEVADATGFRDFSPYTVGVETENYLSPGAGSFNLTVDNSGGQWNSVVGVHAEVKIQLGSGSTTASVMAGYAENVEKGLAPNTLNIYGQAYGAELNQTTYTNIFYNTGLSHVGKQIVAGTSLHATGINDISESGSFRFRWKYRADCLTDVFGGDYDIWDDYSKEVHIRHKQDASDTGVVIRQSGTVVDWGYSEDVSEAVTRVVVFGARTPNRPRDRDEYTEGRTTGWTGSNVTVGSASDSKEGDYSLKITHVTTTDRYVLFPSGGGDSDFPLNLNKYDNLYFQVKQDTVSGIQVRMLTDGSNYFYRSFDPAASGEWVKEGFTGRIGVGDESAGWSEQGTPDWLAVSAMMLWWSSADTVTNLTLVDEWTFVGIPIISVAEDLVAQGSYGVREKIIEDSSIMDEDYADWIAQNELSRLSGKKKRMRLTIPGNPDLPLGDKVKVEIPAHGVDDSFRVTRIRHVWGAQGYTTELELNEPYVELADYLSEYLKQIYGARQEGMDEANLRKWVRFIETVALPGGSGSSWGTQFHSGAKFDTAGDVFDDADTTFDNVYGVTGTDF